jgi:hypothetical protein
MVALDFLRVDERDISASTPRYRYRIVTRNDALRSHNRPVTLSTSGNTTTSSYRHAFSAVDDPAHYYAAYFTMDSAVSEIIGWSTNLRDSLTSTVAADQQAVVMDINSGNTVATTEATPTQKGKIWMPWDAYRAGGTIRHELGHWVHQLIHHKQQARGACVDGRFPTTSSTPPSPADQSHQVDSCEFGYFSTLEGMATFIAVRSATSSDTNAWMCSAVTAEPYDACSANVAVRGGDLDGDGVTSVWQILGDSFADRPSRCSALRSTSCGCGSSCGTASEKNAKGFRVETQFARFAWDLIDTSADSGSVDDVDYSMGEVVAALQGMACSTGTLGVDGTCNEATRSGGSCSLDKYNAYDLAALLPTNETEERTLNCVASAAD